MLCQDFNFSQEDENVSNNGDNVQDPLVIDDESGASAGTGGNYPFNPAGGPAGMPLNTSMGVIGTTFSVMDDTMEEQD